MGKTNIETKADYTIPFVIEKTGRGERSYDIYSRLLEDRIVFIGHEVTSSREIERPIYFLGRATRPPPAQAGTRLVLDVDGFDPWQAGDLLQLVTTYGVLDVPHPALGATSIRGASVPLSHYRHCHSALREIRAKGVKVAIDDLGAGYSNLKYIADLSPEVVKLDRELIMNLTRESRLHVLVTSIVDLCRRQGARVVAEGIETREEMLAVLETGAHYGQGYFLARPARGLQFVDWAKLGL